MGDHSISIAPVVTIGRMQRTDYGRELARFLELGYRAVKLKTGAGTVAGEADRIGAARRAIGDEPLLMLDMNAAYDSPDC